METKLSSARHNGNGKSRDQQAATTVTKILVRKNQQQVFRGKENNSNSNRVEHYTECYPSTCRTNNSVERRHKIAQDSLNEDSNNNNNHNNRIGMDAGNENGAREQQSILLSRLVELRNNFRELHASRCNNGGQSSSSASLSRKTTTIMCEPANDSNSLARRNHDSFNYDNHEQQRQQQLDHHQRHYYHETPSELECSRARHLAAMNDCGSTGSQSTRYTTDSSGFMSAGSSEFAREEPQWPAEAENYYQNDTEAAYASLKPRQATNGQLECNQKRSKLIEDLDKLLNGFKRSDSTLTNDSSYAHGYRPGNSPSTVASTLLRRSATPRECDYSTLCRDEFSTFIAVKQQPAPARQQPKQQHRKARRAPTVRPRSSRPSTDYSGPMLVGVHENSDSCDDEDGDEEQTRYSGETGSSNDCSNDDDDSSDRETNGEIQQTRIDMFPQDETPRFSPDEVRVLHSPKYECKIQVVSQAPVDCVDDYRELGNRSQSEEEADNCRLLVAEPPPESSGNHDTDNNEAVDEEKNKEKENEEEEEDDDDDDERLTREPHKDDGFSEMLDVYLKRMESLLRLIHGDKTVSMEEAFGGKQAEVGAEHRTEIEFIPVHRAQSIRVRQQVSLVDMLIDETETETATATEAEAGDESQLKRSSDNDKVANGEQLEINYSVSSNFNTEIHLAPQTSASLNWNLPIGQDGLCLSPGANSRQDSKLLDLAKLRDLFLSRLQGDEPEVGDESVGVEDEDDDDEHDSIVGDKFPSRPDHTRRRRRLVRLIERHLSEFLRNYATYQTELKSNTSFANDWHQNWLFAYKREPNYPSSNSPPVSWSTDAIRPKRAKLSDDYCDSNEREEQSGRWPQKAAPPPPPTTTSPEEQQIDLIKYSTLILSRCKPIKLTYLAEAEQQQRRRQDSEPTALIVDRAYEAQEEQVEEMWRLAKESNGQLDVCRMLIYDLDCDADDATCSPRKPLLVRYDSSLMAGERPICANNCSWQMSAHGHRFEFSGAKWPAKLSCRFREKFLGRLAELVMNRAIKHQMTSFPSASERVKFLLELRDVQLSQRIPVIQFCAKISGALPICVRWFRGEQEISKIVMKPQRQRQGVNRLRIIEGGETNEDAISSLDWPLEMRATYDYEYQTDWSSWFRFRRSQGEIMFEIREPNLEHDYGQTYRCSIENCYSYEDCCFSLAERKVNARPDKSISAKSASGDKKRPILRTWSQRTLHKPQPKTDDRLRQRQQVQQEDERPECETSTGELRSLGPSRQLASAAPVDENKFGKDFPYHPDNLMKRLLEKNFSPTISISARQRPASEEATAATTSTTTPVSTARLHVELESDSQFKDSFEALALAGATRPAEECEANLNQLGGNEHHRQLQSQQVTRPSPPPAQLRGQQQKAAPRVESPENQQTFGSPTPRARVNLADVEGQAKLETAKPSPKPRSRPAAVGETAHLEPVGQSAASRLADHDGSGRQCERVEEERKTSDVQVTNQTIGKRSMPNTGADDHRPQEYNRVAGVANGGQVAKRNQGDHCEQAHRQTSSDGSGAETRASVKSLISRFSSRS